MLHPGIQEWERKLKVVFDEIDDYLEDIYGGRYKLHPARPARGKTANKGHDGLFNVGATFSAGFGSKYGRGYVVEVDMVTLESVPREVQMNIEADVMRLLREKIDTYMPEQRVSIDKDGNVIKIYGDFGHAG
ncbi:MAG: hypothetical protein ACLFRY_08185 [Spirochaetia bacterium]